METMELEFRGIPLHALQLYFQELDGEMLTDDFPFIFEGGTWKGVISDQMNVSITPSCCVNAVHVLFTANEKKTLDELIKKYRMKTTRAGLAPPRINV